MEFWGDTAFFVLYAALLPPLAAFLRELAQRRFEGPWRISAGILSIAGVVVALTALVWPGEAADKTAGVRGVLQAVYLPLVLGFLVVLVVALWRDQKLTDRWKRITGRGVVIALAVALPLFVLDGLWPWLQLTGGWVPRGLNFHGLFYAGIRVFLALRWIELFQEASTPARQALADPDRVRSLGLTYREEEVLAHLFEGRSNQEIGWGLGIRLGTVKNHVYRIFQKSGASSRKELLNMLAR